MKNIFVLFFLAALSGCTEFKCYSNTEYAQEQAKKFCAQASGNTTLCESLELHNKKACILATDGHSCKASSHTIESFIRISYPECGQRKEENICKENKACSWTFSDPLNSKFDIQL